MNAVYKALDAIITNLKEQQEAQLKRPGNPEEIAKEINKLKAIKEDVFELINKLHNDHGERYIGDNFKFY